jgi:V/A-type H+-transporting ATPase subunit F
LFGKFKLHALVIGDYDMVTGFRLVGIRGVVVSTVDEARHTLSKTVEDIDVALVIISEDFSTKIRNTVDELRLNRIAPLIIELPGRLGPSGAIDLSTILRKAIGVKV